jgi:hypothetical protein
MLSMNAANATIILEGSDALGLHSMSGDPGAVAYRDQVWSAIGGSDPRSIAVIGDNTSGISSGTHSISVFSSVAAAGTLNNYAAVYFQAQGGCCSENDSLISSASAKAAVSSYLSSGGTVMIGNYTGGAEWDFAIGTTGGAATHVEGVGGIGGSSCSDGEKVTATGLANGFTQPPVISCWTHQAYDQAGFFAALGFTESFFDAGPDYSAGFSSLLSNGKTVTGVQGSVPEPGSLALLGLGMLGFAASRRKSAKNKTA